MLTFLAQGEAFYLQPDKIHWPKPYRYLQKKITNWSLIKDQLDPNMQSSIKRKTQAANMPVTQQHSHLSCPTNKEMTGA